MTDLTAIIYADTAHTSDNFVIQRSEPCHHGKRFSLSAASGQQLPYRHPSEPLFPASELVNMPPKRLRELEQMPNHSPRPNDRSAHPLRWDEECLRCTSQTKINFIIGVIRALGMVGFFLWLFASVVSLVIIYFGSNSTQSNYSFNEIISDLIPVYIYIWLFFVIVVREQSDLSLVS